MRSVLMAAQCPCMLGPPRAQLARAPFRRAVSVRPSLLVSSFTQPPCTLTSLCSSMAGMWIGQSPARPAAGQGSRRGASVIVAVGGNSIGNTKGGTRRARTRTSGFRARKLTPGGRKVLKNRRKRGRHTLAPANNYKK